MGRENLAKSGAILQREKETVKVRGAADSLPKSLKVDVSKARRKEAIKVANLEVASELTILDEAQTLLGSIKFEKKLAKDSGEI